MKNIFRSAFLLFAFITLTNIYSFTLTGKIISADKSNTWIQFTVNHTFHSATAVTHSLICNIDFNTETKQINKVAVAAGVETFDSKNSNRDSNAMDAVEALKFPSVKFISTSIAFTENKLTVKGNLTFHGITKEISFNAEQDISFSILTVKGSFNVN